MIVEINGGGFNNRGAQLMLETVVSRIRTHDPNAVCCVETNWSTRAQRASLGLKTILIPAPPTNPRQLSVRMRASRIVGRCTPAMLGRGKPFVRRQDVDALIDISGYAFGDKWGPGIASTFVRRVSPMWLADKPVVLLPQMLGPFHDVSTREAFRPIADHATCIYAREPISFDWLNRTYGDDTRFRMAPDITIAVEPDLSLLQPNEPYACLVPNERMLDQGKGDWSDVYLKYLVEAGRFLTSRNIRIMIVVHGTTRGDRDLAEELARQLDEGSPTVVEDSSAKRLKGLIAGANVLIGSRFHAIVAALSTGVPAVVMGWSHKYEAILKDFDVPELEVSAHDGAEHVVELIERAISDAVDMRERIANAKLRKIEEIDRMWNDVWTLIGLQGARVSRAHGAEGGR